MAEKPLAEKARIYAKTYEEPPYGREVEGTKELLLEMAGYIERLEKDTGNIIEMELFEGDYIPKECCSFTNPRTSGGKSVVDDVNMPCSQGCEDNCKECIIQRILNDYAKLTGQVKGSG